MRFSWKYDGKGTTKNVGEWRLFSDGSDQKVKKTNLWLRQVDVKTIKSCRKSKIDNLHNYSKKVIKYFIKNEILPYIQNKTFSFGDRKLSWKVVNESMLLKCEKVNTKLWANLYNSIGFELVNTLSGLRSNYVGI